MPNAPPQPNVLHLPAPLATLEYNGEATAGPTAVKPSETERAYDRSPREMPAAVPGDGLDLGLPLHFGLPTAGTRTNTFTPVYPTEFARNPMARG